MGLGGLTLILGLIVSFHPEGSLDLLAVLVGLLEFVLPATRPEAILRVEIDTYDLASPPALAPLLVSGWSGGSRPGRLVR